MDKKLFVNYFYNILYQVVTVLAPIITVPYTTKVLGAQLGVNAFTATFVQWFIIFGIMGINNYGIKTIGTVQDDRKLLSKTFHEIFLMQRCNLLLVLVVYLVSIAVSSFDYKLIYFIQGLTILSTMFDISWFYLGIEDFKVNSLRNILVKIIGVALIFLIVKSEADLWKFVLINGLTAIFGQMIMLVQLGKYVDPCKVSLKEAYQDHFKDNLILFVPQIATSIYTVLDQTLVGVLAEDWEAQSAFYQQATRIVRMFLYFITSIGSVIMPRIANVYSKGDNEKVASYLSVTLKLALYLAIPMMFGTASVAPSLVPWFMAPEFGIVGTLIPITTPIILLISLSNVFGVQFLLPTGRMKEFSTSVVLGAVMNLISNVILIPRFGALGACIALVIAEGSVTLYQFIVMRGKLQFNIQKRSIILYFTDAIGMSLIVLLIGRLMGPSLKTNILQVLAGGIFYMAVLTAFREEFHMSVLQKVLKIVKK